MGYEVAGIYFTEMSTWGQEVAQTAVKSMKWIVNSPVVLAWDLSLNGDCLKAARFTGMVVQYHADFPALGIYCAMENSLRGFL